MGLVLGAIGGLSVEVAQDCNWVLTAWGVVEMLGGLAGVFVVLLVGAFVLKPDYIAAIRRLSSLEQDHFPRLPVRKVSLIGTAGHEFNRSHREAVHVLGVLTRSRGLEVCMRSRP